MKPKRVLVPKVDYCGSCGSNAGVSSVFRAGSLRKICVQCLSKRGRSPIKQEVSFVCEKFQETKKVFVKPLQQSEAIDKLRKALRSKGIKKRTVVSMAFYLCGSMKTKKVARAVIEAWAKDGCPDFVVHNAVAHKNESVRPPKANRVSKNQGNKSSENYSDYLAGDLWNAIRRFVLLSASYTCEGCGGQANQVHHKSYDKMTMRGRDTSKLVALCGRCHKSIEFNEAGEKVNLTTANDRLAALVALKKTREVDSEIDREFADMFR